MMRLPPFQYHRPRTEDEAVALVADAPDAMFVAGGTDLYPNMKRRTQVPKTVIGLSGVESLRGVRGTPEGGLRIGAMTTLTDLTSSEAIRAAHPAVGAAASLISTPPLRNMGTIGGNLLLDTRCNYYNQSYPWRKSINFCMKKDGDVCWVAPSSPRCWAAQSADQVPLLCAMGARVRLVSTAGGERVIDVADLYQDDGIAYTKKRPDELLTEVLLPPVNGWRATYFKVRRRGSFDFPVLGVGAAVWFDGDVVTDARIVLGAVGSHPVHAEGVAEVLRGQPLTEERLREAATIAAKPARPLDNTDYHMSWRKKVTRTFVERALRNIARNIPGASSDSYSDYTASGQTLPMV
jgi:4-hydroxybenzoyl-CoA reductase subunit beta